MTFESFFTSLSLSEQKLIAQRLHTLSYYVNGGPIAKAPKPHTHDCRSACIAMQLAEDYRILALILRLHSPSDHDLYALRTLSREPSLLTFYYELETELGVAFFTVVSREKLRELFSKTMLRQILAAEDREPMDAAVLIEAAQVAGFCTRAGIETLHDLHDAADVAAHWLQSAENCFPPNELWDVAGLTIARDGAAVAKWRSQTAWDNSYETLWRGQLAMQNGDEILGWNAQGIPFTYRVILGLNIG